MMPRARPRMPWSAVGMPVVDEVERVLGGAVAEATSQRSGFSPGSADRVVGVTGARAFVKAVDALTDPTTAMLHRREISVLAGLPPGVPAPRLLGSVDDGRWVAVVTEDIAGRHPDPGDIDRVLHALERMPRGADVPSSLARATSELADDVGAWERINGGDEATVHEQDRLRLLAGGALDALDGDHLVHLDLRADNALLDDAGGVWIVDWPWAVRGCGWLDGLTMLLDTRMRDPRCDADRAIDASPLFRTVDRSEVDAVLAALAGLFLESSRRPEPPALAGLRAFQRAEGRAALSWLRERGALARDG